MKITNQKHKLLDFAYRILYFMFIALYYYDIFHSNLSNLCLYLSRREKNQETNFFALKATTIKTNALHKWLQQWMVSVQHF